VSIERRCPLWVISGHRVTSASCPLCAKSRHRNVYSITSSASAISLSGMVRPSALAFASNSFAWRQGHTDIRHLRSMSAIPPVGSGARHLCRPHLRDQFPFGRRAMRDGRMPHLRLPTPPIISDLNDISKTKRLGSHYGSGRSDNWITLKNPAALTVRREAEKDWVKRRRTP
jgi:hypothetical protein